MHGQATLLVWQCFRHQHAVQADGTNAVVVLVLTVQLLLIVPMPDVIGLLTEPTMVFMIK